MKIKVFYLNAKAWNFDLLKEITYETINWYCV